MMEDSIKHISDTSFWIAGFRAQETERGDAVFKDTLAKKLAGEKGLKMVAETPHSKAMAFAMVARTSAIDRLVLSAISQGIDTVINLGAGLDTRPYRLKLPANLKWVEVDYDSLIKYKNSVLAADKPVCRLTRISCDLSNDADRKLLFAKLGFDTQSALVITEGVIGYLTNEQASQLAKDIFEVSSFKLWIQDYSQGKMRNHRRSNDLKKMIKHTPLRFTNRNPVAFFSEQGWKMKENIHILDEADRSNRRLPIMFPWNILIKIPALRNRANKTYGYVMYAKA